MVELADTQDLGSCGLYRGGSSPPTCTRGAIPPNSFPLVGWLQEKGLLLEVLFLVKIRGVKNMYGVHLDIILHPYYIKSYLIQIRGVKNMYGVHLYIILHLDYIKSYPMDKYLIIW